MKNPLIILLLLSSMVGCKESQNQPEFNPILNNGDIERSIEIKETKIDWDELTMAAFVATM